MSSQDDVLTAIGAIGDAGLDPALWPAALARLAALLGAASGSVAVLDKPARVAFHAHVNFDESAAQLYADHYRFLDPVIAEAWRRPVGVTISDETALPKAELRQSALYNEWCRPNDMEHSLQGFAIRDGAHNGLLAFTRMRRQPGFEPADLALMNLLLPHVARALTVQTRLQAAAITRRDSIDALDQMPQAVLLVDADARVIHANQAARDLLAHSALQAGRDGLRGGSPDQGRTLQRLIRRASNDRLGGGVLLDQPDSHALAVNVVPRRGDLELAWTDAPNATAIVIAGKRRSYAHSPVEPMLRELYGLTLAEARIATGVAAGLGVQAAAAGLGIEPSTARTHLVRAYAKTATQRQAELADLVAQLASVVGPEAK